MSAAKTEAVPPPVQVVKTINAPREDVFKAWTDAAILTKWFGPPEVSVSEAEIDPRIGGSYRIIMRGDSGAVHENYGVYREVDFPKRLVFTWCIRRLGSEDTTLESLVSVELRVHKVLTTEVTLTHELLTTEEARRGVRHGWTTGFESLDSLLQEGKET